MNSVRAFSPLWRQRQTHARKIVFCSIGGILLLAAILTVVESSTQNVSLAWAANVYPYQTSGTTPVSTTTPLSQVSQQQGTASSRLLRLSQVDPAQYASTQEYNTWAMSACSAAAMTEVINAYGNHYRITDILQVEATLEEITSNGGLQEDSGLAATGLRFGFKTNWGYNLSLAQIVQKANQGSPVIVGWPPSKYPPGHLLVVRGGTGSLVYLADSSKLNYTEMSYADFLQRWGGLYAIMTPFAKSEYSILGSPTITVSLINQVLSHYHSPTAGMGQALSDLGVKYGIDPVFALAFFLHESLFGTTGEARKTLSLGNERCIQDRPCVDQDRGGYAQMESWQDGFEHFYILLKNLYILQWGRVTISQIIPKFAPSSDGNDEAAYIASVEHETDVWRSGQIVP
jgi:hypothetical protein